ncbi:hypothetical protein RvY_15948-1 [Ramazzottius varieornatus]|uniref:Superoxide dismutase copper/zinc binding domain-containing protein n=1 Tax=Ramazzottius varieornatus TaxID=947166 RepID=A0A1D1VWP9_RAMVA|nr:hypothetical protein RvY_15948-1 [Ramazzottius varieornatus]
MLPLDRSPKSSCGTAQTIHLVEDPTELGGRVVNTESGNGECWDSVEFSSNGIESITFDLPNGRVLVKTSLPSDVVQKLIEQTGRKAVLKGIGAPGFQLGAAVAEFYHPNGVKGVARFVQLAEDRCLIDGTVDGLSPGNHGVAVCESGDLSNGCERLIYVVHPYRCLHLVRYVSDTFLVMSSIGDHYNPTRSEHGTLENGHVGDLGNVCADDTGRASFRIESRRLRLPDIIGRALALHDRNDDYGRGPANSSTKSDGNAGPKIACGIIARSAGIMQNEKRICTCSGETLWEERDAAKAKMSATGKS